MIADDEFTGCTGFFRISRIGFYSAVLSYTDTGMTKAQKIIVSVQPP